MAMRKDGIAIDGLLKRERVKFSESCLGNN